MSEGRPRRVGLYLVGARGAISTCVVYGLAGLREGLLEPLGLVTASEAFEGVDLVEPAQLVLGGADVAARDLSRSAGELVRAGVLGPELVAASSAEAAAFDARVDPGVLDGPDVGMADLLPESARLGAAPPLEQIEAVRANLAEFREASELDRVVVVELASTESAREDRAEWQDLASFRAALERGEPQPASVVYACAALESGAPFVNFTPNRGASVPALRELARERGVPHCGNDAKTGETLLKTALAPMFVARNLRVLSWHGYNMLGNRDGEVLTEPGHKQAKVQNKDDALREILRDDRVHSYVGIDYVPSLGDWKTAWDFIHFQGFLGARMSLQFTWQGSDSALAAPLVLDLARLADLAAERGEAGEMEHTACFFKSPLVGDGHDFHAQTRHLHAYAGACAGRS